MTTAKMFLLGYDMKIVIWWGGGGGTFRGGNKNFGQSTVGGTFPGRGRDE